MKYKDYYAILGIPRAASADEVRKAYRSKAREQHPDLDRRPGATGRFQELAEAYAVLRDPEQRARYDRLGARWRDGDEIDAASAGASGTAPRWPGARPETEHFSDFFRAFFGGDRGNFDFAGVVDEGLPEFERPMEVALPVDVALLVRGGEQAIEVELPGAGRASGVLRIPPSTPPETVLRVEVGVPGRRLRGGTRRALHVRLEPELSAGVAREGDDLVTELRVAPHEAALGARVPLSLPGGGTADVRVPEASSSATRLRLRGQGLPKQRGGRGDLLAELRIVLPPRLSSEERRLWGELARASRFAPRDGPGRHFRR